MIWYIVENTVNNKKLLCRDLEGALSHYKWDKKDVKIKQVNKESKICAVRDMLTYIADEAVDKSRVFNCW